MDISAELHLFQSISARLMLLCFLGLLILSLWKKHGKPFLAQEQEGQKLALEKLEQSNAQLRDFICNQEHENNSRKKELFAIKQTFLAWHQQRIAATAQIEAQSKKDDQAYKERMAQKQLSILANQQTREELFLIMQKLRSTMHQAYHGESGRIRLEKMITDLEEKAAKS